MITTFTSTTIPAVATNMTGVAVLTGTQICLGVMQNISFQAVWTGTPVGTFSFEASNDEGPTITNWTALSVPTSFASGAPAGSATSFIFELPWSTFRWCRIKYTNTSSTGTLFVTANVK